MIFQIYAYKVYHRNGYITRGPDGKLQINDSQVLPVLDELAGCFERVLDCMDARDGAGLEQILFEEMSPETQFVRDVVAMVNSA